MRGLITKWKNAIKQKVLLKNKEYQWCYRASKAAPLDRTSEGMDSLLRFYFIPD
ncbi:hypothetical protein [Pleionea sp. CnH1-48]|uniref:hypothetical protein n=1 Tax=Pleionea sp. CnH1-48 TaxID=2954494 RepID=UPI002096FDDB|nr:hypothetical protein [Pleionea sp. CnH1-48]MCO7225658.1 hypothetical protein [Pleionea sp. CnH1-48]